MIFKKIVFKGHPILGNLNLNLCKGTGEPYKIIIFVGENGCGKTTILNEIYSFNETRFISKEKSEFVMNTPLESGIFEAIYLRQDHKYCSALDEISEKICSEKVFEKSKKSLSGAVNVINLRSNVNINQNCFVERVIAEMGNERLKDFVKRGLHNLANLYMNVPALVKIESSETESQYIDSFSSGEQEILMFLKELRHKLTLNTDCVLLDEPETSLHPQWQLKILDLIKSSLYGKDDDFSKQLFIATHSENILKQALKDNDILIIQMVRREDKISANPISKLDLRLSQPTYVELQYVVFGVYSAEYHNLLISEIIAQNSLKSIKKLDEFIESHKSYDIKIHERKSKGKKLNYKTLPVYIRNKYHHPEMEDYNFSEEQLITSIILLREILKKKI